MTIHFENASDRRKELVRAMGEVTGCTPKYLGAPAFDYKVGDYIVHKDGSVDADELPDMKEIGILLQGLRARGFVAEDGDWNKPHEAPRVEEWMVCMASREIDGIALSFPMGGMNAQTIDNLRKLIAAKGALIKLALDVDELPVEVTEDKVTFVWLPSTAPGELIEATTCLLAALIKLAKKLKRVTASERATDNPRYAFRCFLLRLGFIGNDYKTVRRRLMQGIPGNGSMRRPIVEFDAATASPDIPPDTQIVRVEKLNRRVIEEEAAAEEAKIGNASDERIPMA